MLTGSDLSRIPVMNAMKDQNEVMRIYRDSLNTETDTLYFKLTVKAESKDRNTPKCGYCKCGGKTVEDLISAATLTIYRKKLQFASIRTDNQHNETPTYYEGVINNLYHSLYITFNPYITDTYGKSKTVLTNQQIGGRFYGHVEKLSETISDTSGTDTHIIYIEKSAGLIGYTADNKTWFIQ